MLKRKLICAALVVSAVLSQGSAALASKRLPYYMKENEMRYQKYMVFNKGITYENTLRLVNARVDLEFYSQPVVIENPDDLLVLCSKNWRFSSDYEPSDLRNVGATGVQLRNNAAGALEQMMDAMYLDGLGLAVISGYRSYATQKYLYNSRINSYGSIAAADRDTARAGHSEHQTGLAVDILQKVVRPLGNANFQNTEQYQWLKEHAHEYGYIERYPREYVSITGFSWEPWHWRFIGTEAATAMKINGYVVFEQYWGEVAFLEDEVE